MAGGWEAKGGGQDQGGEVQILAQLKEQDKAVVMGSAALGRLECGDRPRSHPRPVADKKWKWLEPKKGQGVSPEFALNGY